jgi:pimeloyl-ACP methyl ester carboxylesterase
VTLVGQGFGGGICAYYAAKRRAEVALVLLCPQLDYKKRTIDSRPYWTDDHLDEEVARQLTERGYIDFTPTFRHGRAMSTSPALARNRRHFSPAAKRVPAGLARLSRWFLGSRRLATCR